MRFRYGLRHLMLAVAVAAFVAGLIAAAWRGTSNHVVIENRSGSVIVSLSVTVAGRAMDFSPIPPGGTAEGFYHVGGDDDFVLAGKMSDGTRLGGNFGYVTNGMYGDVARFVIGPGGAIDFSQGN